MTADPTISPFAVGRPLGMASTDAAAVGTRVLRAWDAFTALAAGCDLAAPSRLPGWRAHEVCVHLGSWPEHQAMRGILAAARGEGGGSPSSADRANDAVTAAHRDAPREAVLDALHRARSAVADFFAADSAELATVVVPSLVGPLPVLGLVNAGTYELAVHALDLRPAGAPAPPAALLDTGLSALMDVTGALAARHSIDITVAASDAAGGWLFASSGGGWSTEAVGAGRVRGTAVTGPVADILDVSAGRSLTPAMIATGRLRIHSVASFLRLAPLVEEVPGLPGGPALRVAGAGIGRIGGLLGRLPGLRR